MGNRKLILTTIKDELDDKPVTGLALTIRATNTFFDPDLRIADFPLFSVVSEPENIIVSLNGTKKDRTLRVAIIGYGTAPPDEVFLDGEDIAEEVVQILTSAASAAVFRAAAIESGCGFSITNIGPVIVEQFEFNLNFVYMSIPCTVEYIDP